MKLIMIGKRIINIEHFSDLYVNGVAIWIRFNETNHVKGDIEIKFKDEQEAIDAYNNVVNQLFEKDKKPTPDLESHAADSLRYATACDSGKKKFDLDIMQHNIEASRGNIEGLELANNILANRIDALEKAIKAIEKHPYAPENFETILKHLRDDIMQNVNILRYDLTKAINDWQRLTDDKIASIQSEIEALNPKVSAKRSEF